jgi:hypothetical protein
VSEPSQMTPLKDALLSAKFEIESLRRRNEVLNAKVETMELCKALLLAQVQHGGGLIGIDVVWQLQKELDKLEKPAEANRGTCEGEGPSAQELGAAVRASGQVGKGMSGR